MIGFFDKQHGCLIGGQVAIYDPVIILKPEMIYLAEGVRIDSFVKIEGGQGVHIGKCVHISSFCHINGGGGSVQIGDYAGFASGVKVLGGTQRTDMYCMSAAAPADKAGAVRSVTVIGNRAFLATNCVVLPGVTVGEDAIIAAGAVVTHDVPAGEIWAGVPARKIGERQR